MGLKFLEKNDYVSLLCKEHNKEMIKDKTPSHNGFVDRSNIIIDILKIKNVAENVAYNYKTPLSVLYAWLKSLEHRKNIEGDFTHFGISITDSGLNNYYTTIFYK
jgi:uncharacterized protein YkwD